MDRMSYCAYMWSARQNCMIMVFSFRDIVSGAKYLIYTFKEHYNTQNLLIISVTIKFINESGTSVSHSFGA